MSYFVRRIMKTITFDNSTVKKSSFTNFRSSGPEVYLGKGVLKICSKFTGDRPCESAISIKLLHIFRTTFLKNTSGWLLLWFPEVKVLWKVCGNCAFLQSKFPNRKLDEIMIIHAVIALKVYEKIEINMFIVSKSSFSWQWLLKNFETLIWSFHCWISAVIHLTISAVRHLVIHLRWRFFCK